MLVNWNKVADMAIFRSRALFHKGGLLFHLFGTDRITGFTGHNFYDRQYSVAISFDF